MIEIVIPADWSPFDLCSMVVLIGTPGDILGPLGLISWYEMGMDTADPDPRFNLTRPMGLQACSRSTKDSRWSNPAGSC